MKTIAAYSPNIAAAPKPPSLPDVGLLGTEEASKTSFSNLLTTSLHEVNALQTSSEAAVHDLLTGKSVNSAEVLTSVQKADMAFRLMQQIRNKLVEAYREINQMQV